MPLKVTLNVWAVVSEEKGWIPVYSFRADLGDSVQSSNMYSVDRAGPMIRTEALSIAESQGRIKIEDEYGDDIEITVEQK